ncbi:YDG domain-containing protein [uncultured Subdoligranulum sp.]|uniref:YDG domain-containing protein n=1 Tax=uncultured Subdoligranulum sp. TaxID=512298 RepID=UPI002632F030|nr:YDG domain-containing protein [uncultured Subdoligranulum sp.]
MDRKKTLFERASALIVAVAMLASMIPTQVFAQGDVENKSAATSAAAEPESTPAVQKDAVADKQDNTSGAQQGSTFGTQQGDTSGAQQGATPAAQQSSTPATQQSNAPAAPNGGTPELRSTAVSEVTLNENSCELEVDESKTLVATVTPGEAPQGVIWESDNDAVVTVNGGTITAKAEGTATITVTATNGTPDDASDDKTASCTVVVSKKSAGLSVSVGTPAITYGDSLEMNVSAKAAGKFNINGRTVQVQAGQATTVKVDGLKVGTSALTYTFTPDDTTTYATDTDTQLTGFTVNPKTLTVSQWTLADTQKVYDGSKEFAVSSVTPVGVVGGDAVSVDLDAVYGEASAADVGTYDVALCARENQQVLTGADAANYTLNLSGASPILGEITHCEVTLQQITFTDKTYDGTTDVAADSATYTFAKTADASQIVPDLSVDGLLFAVDDSHVGAKNVNIEGKGILAEGEETKNYSWDGDTSNLAPTVNIVARPITLSLKGSLDKISDGTNAVIADDLTALEVAVTCELAGVTAQVNNTAGWTYASADASAEPLVISGMTADQFILTRNSAQEATSDYEITFGTFSGKISPIKPAEDKATIDLTGANGNQVELEPSVSVQFAAATVLGSDNQYWYTGENAAVTVSGDASFFQYEAQPVSFQMQETASGNKNSIEGVYLKGTANQKVYGPYTIEYAYDNSKPTITADKVEALDVGSAADGKVMYTVEVADTGSGVQNVQYFVTEDPDYDVTQIGTDDWKDGNLADGQIQVVMPAKGYVFIRAMDYVGIYSDVSRFHPLVVEGIAPVAEISVDGSASAKTHTIHYLATDLENPYSGVQSVTFTLYKQNESQEWEDTGYSFEGYQINNQDFPDSLDQINDYVKYESDITLDNTIQDGIYKVVVVVKDFCGNTAEAETETFTMDNTAPKATVTMAKTQPAQDQNYYYKEADAGVTITLEDANVPEGLTYSVVVDEELETPEEVSSGTLTSEDPITLTPDVLGARTEGTHTLTLQVQDAAGNVSSYDDVTFVGMRKTDKSSEAGATGEVIIDNTAPVVELALDGANPVDGVFYANAINCGITVTVTDANVAALGQDAAYTVSVDGLVNSTEQDTVEDTVRTMFLSADAVAMLANGEKTITVTAMDAAGNEATVFDSISNAAAGENMTAKFNLDTYAPQLTKVTSTDGNLYEEGIYYTFNEQNQIVITYTIEDDPNNNNYYNEPDYRLVTVTKDNEAAPDASINYDESGVITVTIPIPKGMDRVQYGLSITAKDKANNLLVLADNIQLEDRDQQTEDPEGGTFRGKYDKIVDTVAPVAEITYTDLGKDHFYHESGEDGPATAYYNQNLEVKVTLTDAGSLDDDKIWYARTYEGVQDAFGHFGDKKGVDNINPQYTGGNLTVEALAENNGTYVYSLYGEDKAGNPLTVNEADYFGAGTTRQETGRGTAETVYTGAPKALDTVAPTAIIDYTKLDATHYYTEGDTQVNAYYNHDFTASFTFSDTYGTAVKSYGMDASKMHYIQKLTDEKDQTLGNTIDQATMSASYTVSGQADNAHYVFGAYGVDKAGNLLKVTEYKTNRNGDPSKSYDAAAAEDCQLNYHKVLDTVAPTFELNMDDPDNDLSIAVDAQNRAYYNKDIAANFTVKDSNLDPEKVKIATASKTGTNFNYDAEDVTWQTIALGDNEAVTEETELALSDTVTDDGIYRFQIEGEDRAGNRLVQNATEAGEKDFRATLQQGAGQFWTYVKVHDTLAPTLDVEFADHEVFYKALLGEMTQKTNTYYNLQINKPYRQSSSATGTLTKTDCSPTSVVYEISSSTASQGEPGSAYSHDNLSLNISGQQIFTIAKLEIRDRAGNTSTMPKESNKIYLDVTAPEADELVPTVSVVAKQSGEGRSVAGRDLFSSGVDVRATVTDPGEGVYSSGLYHVYYQVLVNDADWTDKVSVSGKGSVVSAGVIGYGTSGKDYESTVPVDETITSQDVIDFGFDANTFNYNDVKIYVWAEDNSGNLLTQAEAAHYYFGIDITTPTIDVRYDNNDAQNEKYFKDDRTATITVTERNFDPSQTIITTESSQISDWTYQPGGMDNGDEDQWIATVAYTEDGDYTFDVTTTDLVGHKADAADYGDSVAPREFTIDKTNPIINITFDNNAVRNGKYYNKTRTATVNIEEHNFSTDGVTLTTTANIQEGSVTAPGAGGWSEAGDNNTATVPFTQDGNYTMHVEYVDLAGNEAEPQDVDEFVVDTTEPELTFSINGQAFDEATYEPQAYNGEVVPSITYHDINYDADGTQMSIVGAKNVDSQILSGAPAEDAMGGVYTCENIEQTPENDDVYTCTGKVMDMAGNESTVDFVFSVNRYGSNYLLGDATQQLVDSYYTNQAPTLDVTEVNVNTLKFKEITYALNGNIQTLEPDSDYSVTESGTETSWKQYDYKIFDSNFTQEGVYDITISSEDEAGNLNSNHTERVKEYSKNISFVLDQTAPSITISGVEEDGRYDSDTRSISINYSENFAMDNVTVTNGEKTETYTAEQLEATNGMIEFVVPASNKKQAVTVTAADKAGNTVSTESPYFLLTSNKFVQFVNNTPLLVGSIVVLLLVVAAVVDYLRKGFLYALLHKKAADKQ